MVVELFVKRIINDDNKFSDVPSKIRVDVAQKLIDKGHGELVPTEYGGTLKQK